MSQQYCGTFDISRFDTLPDGIFDCVSTTNIPDTISVSDSQTNTPTVTTSRVYDSSISYSE